MRQQSFTSLAFDFRPFAASHFFFACIAVCLTRIDLPCATAQDVIPFQRGVTVHWNGNATEEPAMEEGDEAVVPAASMMQQTPFIEPRIGNDPQPRRSTQGTATRGRDVPTGRAVSVSVSSDRVRSFSRRDHVSGEEASPQASSDLGELLKKSSSALSTGVQSKTPVVHDPRIRGSRVGSLAASGSYWVPARADLDTMLSKFDSRQVESTTIIPGPYSALYGPGFSHTDVQLYSSPRYQNGFESHGATDLEYRSNGNQFFGQQSFLIGSSNWGSRLSIADRIGDDYRSGGGTIIPSAYRSQEITFALGRDWKNDSVELNVLRQDQQNVIFPGYVFDIDSLATDGYELSQRHRSYGLFDEIVTDVWLNRTRFVGNAQNLDKRPFFPALDLLSYRGFTDVDSLSTGYRQSFVLGGSDEELYKFTIGHDLRFIQQELNEVSDSLTLGFPIFLQGRNSPIPKSYIANPGIFAEYVEEVAEKTSVRIGGRYDYAGTDITDSAAKLSAVGLDVVPASYAEIVGTNQFDRSFNLLAGFVSIDRKVAESDLVSVGLGYAERAPTLTELYAAQPFMLLLQNGLNNVTGDPTLQPEKLLQLDIGFERKLDFYRAGVRGYHAWAFDYITFENTQTTFFPPDADTRQVSLRYVNTDFATLTGIESYTELLPEAPWTPFGNLRFVEGTDWTRNGRFATSNGATGSPSVKDGSQVRGAASGIVGGDREPLPNIPPLEARVGVRWHDTSPANRWKVEFSARIVDQQNRVASSLLESATPGFTTWDLRSTFRPMRKNRMIVSTGIENLFDRRYREHFDFRTPSGLSIYQPGVNFYVNSSFNY